MHIHIQHISCNTIVHLCINTHVKAFQRKTTWRPLNVVPKGSVVALTDYAYVTQVKVCTTALGLELVEKLDTEQQKGVVEDDDA